MWHLIFCWLLVIKKILYHALVQKRFKLLNLYKNKYLGDIVSADFFNTDQTQQSELCTIYKFEVILTLESS